MKDIKLDYFICMISKSETQELYVIKYKLF